MSVVVDDHDVARFGSLGERRNADNREPSLHAVEIGDGVTHDIERNFELVGRGDHRERVQNIVRARHANGEVAQLFISTKTPRNAVSRPENTGFFAR